MKLQNRLQEFTAQAKQNLPEAAEGHSPVSVVNLPTLAMQTFPINLTTTATAINNNNIIKIDLGSLRSDS